MEQDKYPILRKMFLGASSIEIVCSGGNIKLALSECYGTIKYEEQISQC